MTQVAARAAAARDFALAERTYARLLTLPADDREKRVALRQMAEMHAGRGNLAQAAAVYEKFLALFPTDPAAPDVLLQLGLVYRRAGLFDLAISRLYRVLNASLKAPVVAPDGGNGDKEDFAATRNRSLRAQFEIAETYFLSGDLPQAAKFYAQLGRLDLPPADRATASFKALQVTFLQGDHAAAAEGAKQFLSRFGDSPHVPECRHLLARSLQALRRPAEALAAVLELLRLEKGRAAASPETWALWQKKTGLQVADEFYRDGDFHRALAVYQALAALDKNPEAQWPAIYQIGLCFERLRLPARATEAYGFLLADKPREDGKGNGEQLSPALRAIRDMARWRGEHLAWLQSKDVQFQALLGPVAAPAGGDQRGGGNATEKH